MSIYKKIGFVALFVIVTLFLPAVLLLLFFDSQNSFGVYVIVFGVILFSILGYIVMSLKSMTKQVEDALDEMKKQNAAIAYKLTNTVTNNETDSSSAADSGDIENKSEEKPEKINLNPDDPLDFK